MMLRADWSQLCVKAGISFSQRIPHLTDGDKELVQFCHSSCLFMENNWNFRREKSGPSVVSKVALHRIGYDARPTLKELSG